MANLFNQQKEWSEGRRRFKPWKPRDFKRRRPSAVEFNDFGEQCWIRYEYEFKSGYRLSCIAKYIGAQFGCADKEVVDVRCNRPFEIAILDRHGELSQMYVNEWGDSVTEIYSSGELLYWLNKAEKDTVAMTRTQLKHS
ncbi:hypothetical protein Si103_00747 [Streptococcus infantarius subsp. infantarius]|nr:hypothetical protein [Streptococcus infantarius subsp. infantarius]MCO4551832.1 hypothetical protein [Streptococcus infantarius subsp. infantarius]MCO4564826.1 hypothetical protein [Streptococcus infantarius subsp. infantarius]